MKQSLGLSNSFYETGHTWLSDIWEDNEFAHRLSVVGFDFLGLYIPLGSAWTHEEWHRSILGMHGIDSFNEVYSFPIGKGSIAVDHVRDEDLARLKWESPADMVRLSAAGMEAQIQQNFEFERSRFLNQNSAWMGTALWFNQISVTAYLFTCASGAADTFTDEANQVDGTNISKRDFTGLDCTAWAYDLFRPDEPYAARGIHPSGVGINRYRKFSDLNSQEQDELRRQTFLSTINYLDPYLFNMGPWYLTDPVAKWTARARHHLTPFGSSISAVVMLEKPRETWIVSASANSNGRGTWPGLEVEFLPSESSYRITSVRAGLWSQPKFLRYDSDQGAVGGFLQPRWEFARSEKTNFYLEICWKSGGWIAGEPSLEPSLRGTLGANWRVFE